MHRLPVELYRTEQVRQMDLLAISQGDVTGQELMARAGRDAFRLLRMHWAEYNEIIVFCGGGNNGGDGYVLAKIALETGLSVQVIAVFPPEKLKGDALLAYQHYQQIGGEISPFQANMEFRGNIIIDALLGTGINRAVIGDYALAIEAINQLNQRVISLDVPSGLNANTGAMMGCAVQADVTISFIGLKRGLFTGVAADYCGELFFSALDVPQQLYQEVPVSARHLHNQTFTKRSRCSHKGDYGHVLIIGGDKGYCGAVLLAATAAARSGAGLVSIATRPEHVASLDSQLPELMCHGITEMADLQVLIDKATVIVIGCGLGQGLWARDLLETALASDKKCVVDADALNLLAQQPIKKNNWILTPHPGEAARLLNYANASEIQQDRFTAVNAIQQRYGGVCVLKGAGTLIDDGEQLFVSTTGNPGMASGGMGDVLAGVIGGLLAQKFSPLEAAYRGCYVHGKAADRVVETEGERGLLASDLFPEIRRLVN